MEAHQEGPPCDHPQPAHALSGKPAFLLSPAESQALCCSPMQVCEYGWISLGHLWQTAMHLGVQTLSPRSPRLSKVESLELTWPWSSLTMDTFLASGHF